MEQATRLLAMYERGAIVHSELICRLVQLAADEPPEQIAPSLSPDCLAEVRAMSAQPPAAPEDAPRIFHAGSWVGPHDHQAEERLQRRRWYDGIWCWHHYFRADA